MIGTLLTLAAGIVFTTLAVLANEGERRAKHRRIAVVDTCQMCKRNPGKPPRGIKTHSGTCPSCFGTTKVWRGPDGGAVAPALPGYELGATTERSGVELWKELDDLKEAA